MNVISKSGTYRLGDRQVVRLGYGAMQLTGPGAFGPPEDRGAAIALLRTAVESGVNHIDTADFYGPHITNQIIKEALHPYSDDLTIVTKVGASRGDDGSWKHAQEPFQLVDAVTENLRNLGVDVLDVVNLRIIEGNGMAPVEGSIESRFTALAELQQKGVIRHLGLSNATEHQIAEAQLIAPVVCVQNHYNLVHRSDDVLIDKLADQGIAFVPFFPLGGFNKLQSDTLSRIASELNATPLQVALAWLLARAPNVLLIPGTSKVAHLQENLSAADLSIPQTSMAELDRLA